MQIGRKEERKGGKGRENGIRGKKGRREAGRQAKSPY